MAYEKLLDASAVLALVFAEPGMDLVRTALRVASVHTYTLAEVLSKMLQKGIPEPENLVASLNIGMDQGLGIKQAVLVARWHARTRAWGLSMGDCLCLALAEYNEVPVLTADRNWLEAAQGSNVKVVYIRPDGTAPS